MPNKKSTMLFNIPANQVAPEDDWVENQLAASTLPSVLGTLTSEETLTTDETYDIEGVVDVSGSLTGLEEAVISGMEGTGKPDNPGLYAELKKVARAERAKFRAALHLFNQYLKEIYPLTRLFIPDTNPGMQGKDMRNPDVVKLSRVNYRPNGTTNTILAMQRILADAMLYNKVMAGPGIEQPVKHVLYGVSDGFCNEGTQAELAEFRKTVLRLRKQENWTFLFFFIADPRTVSDFRSRMANADADWYIQKLIADRALVDDTVPNGVTGELYTAEDKAWAQLMFEAMGTGWGAYAQSKSAVASLTGENGKIAKLYLAGEEAIEETVSGYTAQGGFAFPASNVSTIFFEPQGIAKLLGLKVSSSVIASVGLGNGPTVAPAGNTPADPSQAW